MTKPAIPTEAERAAEAAYSETLAHLRLTEGGGFKVASQVRRSIHSAIQAAAPHMLRAVWDEAYGKGFEAARGERDTTNPYEVGA